MADDTGGFTRIAPAQTGDAADGWTRLKQAAAATKPQADQEKPSTLDALWEGLKKGVASTGRGMAQIASRMPSPLQDLGLMPGAAAGQQRMQADIDRRIGAGEQAFQQNPARIAHPLAAGAGDIAGQFAATAPLMAIPGGAGPALASRGAQLAARAGLGAMGGAAGAATQPVVPPQGGQPMQPGAFAQQKLQQMGPAAALGAGMGTAGGLIGPQVTQAMQSVVQQFPALGRMALGIEGRDPAGFQRAFANHVLEPIGQMVPRNTKPGDTLLDAVDERLDDAYNAIKPHLKFDSRDPSFTQKLEQINTDAGEILTPAKAKQYTSILRQQVEKPLAAGGVLTGDGFKKMDSDLGTFARRFAKGDDPDNHLLSESLRNVQGLLRETLADQNGAVADRLRNIDKAWRRSLTLDRAAERDVDGRRVFTPGDIRRTFGGIEQRRNLSPEETLMRRFSEVGEDVIGGRQVQPNRWLQIATDIAGATAGATLGHQIGHPIYGAGAGVAAARAAAPAIGAAGRLTQGPQARQVGAAVSRATPVVGASAKDRDAYVSPAGP